VSFSNKLKRVKKGITITVTIIFNGQSENPAVLGAAQPSLSPLHGELGCQPMLGCAKLR